MLRNDAMIIGVELSEMLASFGITEPNRVPPSQKPSNIYVVTLMWYRGVLGSPPFAPSLVIRQSERVAIACRIPYTHGEIFSESG